MAIFYQVVLLDGWICGCARVSNIYDMGVLFSINGFNKKEVGRNDLVSPSMQFKLHNRTNSLFVIFFVCFFIIFHIFYLPY